MGGLGDLVNRTERMAAFADLGARTDLIGASRTKLSGHG